MAFRNVFVNFSSNAGAFANQMTYAAQATQYLSAAQTRLAISSRKVDMALAQRALAAHRAGAALTDYGAKLALVALKEEELAKQRALAQTRLMSGQSAILGRIAVMAGAGITAGFAAATIAAGRLETRIANIATISDSMRTGIDYVNTAAGQSRQAFESARADVMKWTDAVKSAEGSAIDMREAILDLSTQFPQSAGVLAEALYEITSSGFDGSEALQVLYASAAAATAGLTDAQTAAKGITSVLNAYGRDAYNAAQVSDILFKTVELGVIRFEEISEQLGDFVAYGAAAGVRMEELGAAMATITLAGIPTAQAATSLNRVLQSIVKPSEALSAVFRDLGYASGVDALKGLGGLHKVLEAVQKQTGGSVAETVKLFNEIRAARGVLALTTNDMTNYNRVNGEFSNKNKIAGATLRALREQQKTFEYQLQQLRDTINRVAVSIGERLLPAAKTLVETFKGIFEWFSNLSDGAQKVIGALVGLAGIFLLTWGGMFRLVTMVQQYRIATMGAEAATQAFSLSLGMMSLAAGILAVALTGIAIAFMKNRAARAREQEAIRNHISLLEAEAAGAKGTIDENNRRLLAEKRLTTALKAQNIEVEEAVKQMSGKTRDVDALAESFAKVLINEEKLRNMDDQGRADKIRTYALRMIKDELNGVAGSWDTLRRNNKAFVEDNPEIVEALKTIGIEFRNGGEAAREFRTMQDEANESAKNAPRVIRDYRGEIVGLNEEFFELNDRQQAVADSLGKIADASIALERAAERVQILSGSYTDPGSIFSNLLKDEEEAIRKAAESRAEAENESYQAQINALEETLTERRRMYQDAAKEAKGPLREEVRVLEDQLKNLKDEYQANKASASDFASGSETARVSVQQWTQALREAAERNDAWRANLQWIRGMLVDSFGGLDPAKQGFLKTLSEMGEEGIPLVQGLANMTKEQIDEIVAQHARLAPETAASLEEYTQSLMDLVLEGQQFLDNYQTLLKHGYRDVAQHLGSLGKDGYDLMAEAAAQVAAGQLQVVENLRNILPEHARVSAKSVREAHIAELDRYDEVYQRIFQRKGNISRASLMAEFADITPAEMNKIIRSMSAELQMMGDVTLPLRLSVVDKISVANPFGGSYSYNPNGPATPQAISGGMYLVVGSGGKMLASGGILEDHQAQIAPAGAWRVWAEPETGGEAYIPLAASKRDRSIDIWEKTGKLLGVQFSKFAMGGWAGPKGTHRNWRADGMGTYVHQRVASGMGKGADIAVREIVPVVVDPEATGEWKYGGPDTQGQTYRSIISYLRGTGVPHRVVSTVRPGAITATGKPSYHGKGRAVDFGGPGRYGQRDTPELLAINRAFLPIASRLRELIYSGPGAVEIHNGRPHDYTGITHAMHRDHVHVAMKYGGILRALRNGDTFNGLRSFDRGGVLPPGFTMSHNGTGRPEYVVNGKSPLEKTLAKLERSLSGRSGKTVKVENHFHEKADPIRVGAEIAWRI
jgi:TP901 family phage tail tape measure protein